MYATSVKIPTVPAVASRTVARISATIPAGGFLAVPHGCGFALADVPAGLPGTLKMLIGLSLASNVHPYNPIYLVAADASDVVIGNVDVAPADVVLDVVLLPPWLGLDGVTGPGGVGPRNYAAGFQSIAPAGTAPFGPYLLTDETPPIVGFVDPIAVGHVPVFFGGPGDWIRYQSPDPFAEIVGVINDGPGAEDVVHFGAILHSVNRYSPTLITTPNDLFNVIGPIQIPPSTQLAINHGLRVDGIGAIPDLAWLIPVGSAAPGVALGAPNYVTRDDVDQVRVVVTNQNAIPGSDVAVYLLTLRAWSGGRIP